MIFSLLAETTCPECDHPIEFEVTDASGTVNVVCPTCGHVESVTFEVVVDVL